MKKSVTIGLIISLFLVTAAFATEFSADMTMVVAGRSSSGKMYFKNAKTFRNEMMGIIVINKYPHSYQIFPDKKQYTMISAKDLKEQNPMADVEDFNAWIKKYNLKKAGTEKLQGFKCTIYEGRVSFSKESPPMNIKLWYSKKLNYPIKSENDLPAPMGKMVSTLTNIKLGAQAATLFEIPAGYTKAESMSEAMGMENDSGQMPSPEEMEKMMKSMQEMMKKGMQ